MESKKSRYILVDLENVQKTFLADLCWVRESDTMVFMHSDAVQVSLTFPEISLLHKTKAKLLFEQCSCGRPSALDFQLSSVLGYFIKECEVAGTKDCTEFCILSKDAGYADAVQFWTTRGFNVTLRHKLSLAPVTVYEEQDKAKQAQMKRRTPGTTNVRQQVLKSNITRDVGLVKQVERATTGEAKSKLVESSAVDKFNQRLQKSKELQLVGGSKLTKQEEEKRKKEAGITGTVVDSIYKIKNVKAVEDITEDTVNLAKLETATTLDITQEENPQVIESVKENLLRLSLADRTNKADWYNNLFKAVKSSEYSGVISSNITKIKRCDNTLSSEDVLALAVQSLISEKKKEFVGYLTQYMDTDSLCYMYMMKAWESGKLNK